MRENRRDQEKNREFEELFHHKIIDWAGNSILKRIMENLDVFQKAFLIYHTISPHSLRVSPHREIIEAFKVGDPETCEAVCRSHVQNAKKALVQQAIGIDLEP